MNKVAYELNGNIEVMTIAPQSKVVKFLPEVKDMTEVEYFEFIKNRDLPPFAVNVTTVTDADLPLDRKDRDSWEIAGGRVRINEQKKADKDEARVNAEASKAALLTKLKITKEELKALIS